MRISSAVRHIEHIASLPLTPHVAIPEMLRSLDGILHGAKAGFFWTDDKGVVLDAYLPFAARGPGAVPGSADRPRIAATAGTSRFLYQDDGGFCMTLRVGDRLGGILSLRRGARASAFTERERRMLSGLAPCFSRALASRPMADQRIDDVADNAGVVIASGDGRLVSADQDARQLLIEMTDEPLLGEISCGSPDGFVPPFLADLVRRHRQRASSASTMVERSARWGIYRARIFPQIAQAAGDGAAGPASYAILLSRHLPQAIRLIRTLEVLDLSPRERQAAFQLSNGADAARGAAALGVSITTWRSYVKRVYQRLDVGDRVGLMNHLLNRISDCH